MEIIHEPLYSTIMIIFRGVAYSHLYLLSVLTVTSNYQLPYPTYDPSSRMLR
jgi:hypothetical protein